MNRFRNAIQEEIFEGDSYQFDLNSTSNLTVNGKRILNTDDIIPPSAFGSKLLRLGVGPLPSDGIDTDSAIDNNEPYGPLILHGPKTGGSWNPANDIYIAHHHDHYETILDSTPVVVASGTTVDIPWDTLSFGGSFFISMLSTTLFNIPFTTQGSFCFDVNLELRPSTFYSCQLVVDGSVTQVKSFTTGETMVGGPPWCGHFQFWLKKVAAPGPDTQVKLQLYALINPAAPPEVPPLPPDPQITDGQLKVMYFY